MKPYTVVFTKNTAVLLTEHKPGVFHSRKARYAVNPDLAHLQSVPRIYWKLEAGEIKEMTRPEKIKRLKQLQGESTDLDAHAHLYPRFGALPYFKLAAMAAALILFFQKGLIHV